MLSTDALSYWPFCDEHDLRTRDIALVDALRADPGSMLHAAVTPADIGQLVTQNVGPSLLLVGGLDEEHNSIADVFEFALGGSGQTWVLRAPMKEKTSIHAATLSAAGVPLVIGGYRDGASRLDESRAVDEFAPRRNSWRSAPALPERRYAHTATTVGGDVFVCGRTTSGGYPSSSVLMFRAGTTEWTPAAPMPIVLIHHTCAALAESASPGFVVAGGYASDFLNSAQAHRYDCASDRWTRLADIGSARYGLRGETLGDGAVYVCGGKGSEVTERLDVRTGSWQAVAPLPVAISCHAVCLFDAATMVSLGGYVDDGRASACCFTYHARADRWWKEPRWELPRSISNHTVTRF